MCLLGVSSEKNHSFLPTVQTNYSELALFRPLHYMSPYQATIVSTGMRGSACLGQSPTSRTKETPRLRACMVLLPKEAAGCTRQHSFTKRLSAFPTRRYGFPMDPGRLVMDSALFLSAQPATRGQKQSQTCASHPSSPGTPHTGTDNVPCIWRKDPEVAEHNRVFILSFLFALVGICAVLTSRL